MNNLNWIIAFIAIAMSVGHIGLGYPLFYRPLQQSHMDTYVKAILSCVFHFLSLFMAIELICFLAIASEKYEPSQDLLLFFAAQNFLFAIALWTILWKFRVKPIMIKSYPAYFYLLMGTLIFATAQAI